MTDQPTQDLAAFLSRLSLDDVPPAVRHTATDILLDTVASAIAGRRGDETQQIEHLANAIGGEPTTTVLAGQKKSMAGAVLLNGYQVTAVTVCDIHRPTLCHVTPEVIPPALAVAEDRASSGKDLLLAVIKGLETVVRVGAGMRYPSMRARGWHSPGVIGPFGGAAAVASLMGLDETATRNALSLAGTQSAGTFAHWGTPTIKFHQSRGSYSGLLAATLAETGFKAGPEILTADHGGLYKLYSDGGDPAAVTAGLGSDWQLGTISLRLWPAASSIQTVITSLFALIEAHDVRPADVETVEVGLSKTVFDMHGELPWDNKFRALLSTPYVTGVVLHDRKCWFDQFSPDRISDENLDAFIRRHVKVSIDDRVVGTGAAVTIRLKNGQTVEDRRDHPRGDAADPLNREEIVQKFKLSADGLMDPAAASKAIDMITGIEALDDVTKLTARLGAPRALAA